MNRNKKKILALILVILVAVLGGASLYISSRINTQQAVAPNAPESEPQAAECVERCPAANGELWSCTPPDSDGSAQKSICNVKGRVEKCGGDNFCCPAAGGAWTKDMSKCPTTAPTTNPTTPTWRGSAACTVQGSAVVVCVPTNVITCTPDCSTACGQPASTITTCKNSCGTAVTKACPATAACGTPNLTIVKKAFWNETTNTAGNYTLTTEINSVSKDQTFVYAIYIENVSTVTAANVTVSDALTGQKQDLLTFVDAQSGCNYAAATRTITCSGLTLAAGAKGTYAFRVKVTGNTANGDVIKNTGKVTYGTTTKEAYKDLTVSTVVSCNNTCTTDDECDGSLVCDTTSKTCRDTACLSVSNCNCPTPTPTPTVAQCNQSCSGDDDCATGLVCDTTSKMCRNQACTSRTNCSCITAAATGTVAPTLASCNKACSDSTDCASGLICDSETQMCRKEACTSKTNCTCDTAAATAAPTVLPEAGILDIPGVAAFGGGLLMAVIGILLAL